MIPLCIPKVSGNEWKYIKNCLDTNWISSVGSYVNKFEEQFKEYVNSKSAIVTMNGTSALQLALLTLGIGKGDEVIVPSMTFVASVNPIIYVGAEPVFVDVDRDTYVMNAEKIEELITDRTKAIIPVHIYGHPVDMDRVNEIAKKHNLFVIEDATESLGSTYKGKHTGTIGDFGCFSFNGNKLITTGAGGMLVTDNKDLGERAKYLSNQAKTIEPNGDMVHLDIGYNFRMPNILAAMGCAQLEKIEEYIEAKEYNAECYNERLKEVTGITLPIQKDGSFNVNWLYAILIEDQFGTSRDELIQKMKECGIETRPFFHPLHEMELYKKYKRGSMEITEELKGKGLCLPSSVDLKSEEIEKVCKALR
ncbi:putative pyridoxal phosphate-dependent aminotransferase EpsN [Andreesenia angusta]|uniref:Putative pyridoxal phosphate-dependent aminotransferase EpsN n=1 Tax=Andreesenia angusta TaxID=39480 RepID=A0A1S1V5Y5_9FIRM|nr:LegC family aminotransferase [Andreesenia angusta]OHW61982.1 putative pyridoxal phosphate-dependent aminotransferase EpsN [Andreesenia angusta]